MNNTERIAEINVGELLKTAQCIYLVCEKPVADDIAAKLKWAADEHDRLTAELEQKTRDVAQLAIESVNREKQMAKLEAEVQHWADMEQDGRLSIIDKELFCRRAAKQGGKCAGYTENMFTHKVLAMCEMCGRFDPAAEDKSIVEEDYEDFCED